MSGSSYIEFLLDGQRQRIDFTSDSCLKPSTTVLNYLRSLDTHKGVKEGCAEGDCGACTVVVASPDENGRLTYQAIDSCLLFLPSIHGRQLITVENLSRGDNRNKILHPVQQAIVSHNGTQCGYCTPGFAMSTFALFKNHVKPSREVVVDALTGNLCRCTGYKSIVHAAEEACEHRVDDQFTTNEKEVHSLLIDITRDDADIELTGKGQKYFLPSSLESALTLRKVYPDALIVSGATDVALRQTKKGEHFPLIIDISAVQPLHQFCEDEKQFTFGAGLCMERIKSLAQDRLPALYSMLSVFGSLQIRNRATLGGNIGSASPIGDTLPLLFAYNASVNLIHADTSTRTLPIEDFITGYRKTALQPNELIYSVTIPKPASGLVVKSYKVSRRKDVDISTVSAAFALIKDAQETVNSIKLAYGGMAAKTQRAWQAEDYLQGKTWSIENIEKAMGMVEHDFQPLSDARSDAQSRRIAASNLLLKFFDETHEHESPRNPSR
ncbi:xanthine dehydrogenase small subunit [Desulfocastanea catecholica]